MLNKNFFLWACLSIVALFSIGQTQSKLLIPYEVYRDASYAKGIEPMEYHPAMIHPDEMHLYTRDHVTKQCGAGPLEECQLFRNITKTAISICPIDKIYKALELRMEYPAFYAEAQNNCSYVSRFEAIDEHYFYLATLFDITGSWRTYEIYFEKGSADGVIPRGFTFFFTEFTQFIAAFNLTINANAVLMPMGNGRACAYNPLLDNVGTYGNGSPAPFGRVKLAGKSYGIIQFNPLGLFTADVLISGIDGVDIGLGYNYYWTIPKQHSFVPYNATSSFNIFTGLILTDPVTKAPRATAPQHTFREDQVPNPP